MDSLGAIIALLLNTSIACTALPADEYRIAGEDYLVLSWRCETMRKDNQYDVWRSWQRKCSNLNNTTHFWSRPYFLQNQSTKFAIYMNEFGELHTGQGAAINQAYVPKCGT